MTINSGSFRLLRGGSWLNNGYNCTVSYWNNYDPNYRRFNIGFRPVRRHYEN